MDEPSASRPFLPDRIVGSLMLAAFAGFKIVWLLSVRNLAALLPGATSRLPSYPTTLGYVDVFLSFAIECFISVGVLCGRRWAFALVAIDGADKAVRLLDSMKTGGDQIGWIFWAHAAFSVLVFLYGGLRLAGSFGPRFPRLLPARNAARFVD